MIRITAAEKIALIGAVLPMRNEEVILVDSRTEVKKRTDDELLKLF